MSAPRRRRTAKRGKYRPTQSGRLVSFSEHYTMTPAPAGASTTKGEAVTSYTEGLISPSPHEPGTVLGHGALKLEVLDATTALENLLLEAVLRTRRIQLERHAAGKHRMSTDLAAAFAREEALAEALALALRGTDYDAGNGARRLLQAAKARAAQVEEATK